MAKYPETQELSTWYSLAKNMALGYVFHLQTMSQVRVLFLQMDQHVAWAER